MTEKARGILVFDVDGTLFCGQPEGKITEAMIQHVRKELKGWLIGALSRKVWNIETRPRLQMLYLDFLECEAQATDEPSTSKSVLTIRKIEALGRLGKDYDNRVYVGDEESDRKIAASAGWKYVHSDVVSKLALQKEGVMRILDAIKVR